MIDLIRTERLELVPINGVEDAGKFADGDLGDLVAGSGWPRTSQSSDALAHVIRSGVAEFWLIVLGGVILGHVFWKGGLGPDGRAEIGYGLAAPYRGNGYGAEAVTAMVQWASRQPGVRQLVAETLADNSPSRAVLERAGFTITSTADSYVYWSRETAVS